MDKTTKLLKRIKKLITQAEGERSLGNIDAAEAFTAKAHSLLAEHKLELTDLERVKEDETNPLTYELIHPSLWGDLEQKSRVEFTEDLASTIARAYYCRMLADLESNKLIVLGRKSDVEITKLILAEVMRAALIACETELAQVTISLTEIPGAAITWGKTGGNEEFRFSFFSGFNGRIANRLRRQMEISQEQAGTNQALVKAGKDVDDFMMSLNPVDAPLPERQAIMSQAYRRGVDAGNTVNLFPKVFNENQNKQLGD